MRNKLVTAIVGMTVAVIALYGLPRAYFLADLVQSQEERNVQRSLALIAVVITEREDRGTPVTQQSLDRLLDAGESIEYVDPGGVTTTAGTPPEGHESDIVRTSSLAGGSVVTLARAGDVVDRRVSEALMPLVLIGLGLTLLAGVVGFLLARRLARPFQELADSAGHLGRGRFDLEVPHYTSVPEAERIGAALRGAAHRLDELLQRERRFAVNASHQLRTPITALRLELEDLSMWPQTPPDVAEELAGYLPELDRLGEAISDLLDLSRGERVGTVSQVDLEELAEEAVERWRADAEASGRALVHVRSGRVAAELPRGPLAQILDVLIENAIRHGSGRITVDTDDLGRHLTIRVSDEGSRQLDSDVFHRGARGSTSLGHGIGLAVASELAEAMGGHLALDKAPHTTFVVMLPGPVGVESVSEM